MRAIERLKRDHGILRSKLDVMESALGMGPDVWYVLREVCFTLSRQLQNHMKREEELVMACRAAMDPKLLAEIAVEHRDEPEHLRTLNRLFLQDRGHRLDHIRPALVRAIQGLRHHMAEEERELFPILERELAAREPARTPEAVEAPLHECLTVNYVLRSYPMTKPVFERLFVNLPYEGCDCLDEVAWRRGMESQELLAQLRQTIPLPDPAIEGAGNARELCGCR
jgi:hypothetical protein